MSGMKRGSTISSVNFSSCQPRPNSHASSLTLLNPHFAIVSRAQSAARLCAGDPVSRGPMSSTRTLNIGAVCERLRPSSRIFAIAAMSTGSFACLAPAVAVMPTTAASATTNVLYVMGK